jgi:hypothetical protein
VTVTSLTLFTSARSAASIRAIVNVNAIIETIQPRPKLRIVDVGASPQEAIDEKVFVTPTLKTGGARVLTIVGTLDDRSFVRSVLEGQ